MRRVRGLVRRCRGRSDMVRPRLFAGAFSYGVGLEGADAVAEFVGQAWFGVACEEFLVVDDLAEFGEPVA